MIERREHLGFALEARESFGIARHQLRQHLDGDLSFQLRVGSPIHFAHPAGSNRGEDFIRTESGTGG